MLGKRTLIQTLAILIMAISEFSRAVPRCEAKPNVVAGKGNAPNGFGITNLHFHGLSVSPNPGADNVFLDLMPGKSEPYAFRVPPEHPAGTFWYHPHRHGSTAFQVGSGLAG